MRRCRSGSEDEMVALFLRTEVSAVRFRAGLLEHLKQAGLCERVLTRPNLSDQAENRARKDLLARHRGYGRGEEHLKCCLTHPPVCLSNADDLQDFFEGFPANVRWEWEALTPDEVARVKYIDYSYWVELSGGSRLPADAAPRVRAGIAPFGVSSAWALSFADAISAGADVPPMILVAPHEGADLVVVEGHARLTAYMLRPEVLPAELLALVGYSPDIIRWGCY